MNNPKFKDYLDALGKEQDSNNILKLLSTIRSVVDWPKNSSNINEIRERGSLKHLLNLLQTQQRKHILDVCLSILGNCVMDRNCAREMIGVYNTLSALNHVLKRYPKEDSINGRVFRVLGNLCHHKVDWANLVISRKPQIVTHLVELLLSRSSDKNELKEKCSEATIMMAIRSLKYLINQYTVKHLIKTFPVLNAIGSLFIKSSQEWQESQENQTILNALITLLYTLSRYKDYTMILELKCTAKGNALAHLADVLLLCPKMIIKIIMNFLRVSKLISDLPVRDICNKFIEQVVKKNIDTDDFKTECLDYIKCLCYLLDHPANRNTVQCGKTIPLLIQVLQKLDKPTEVELECCVLLVSTLNKCQFAECLVQEQLQCNILDVVVKKLEWIVDNTDIMHKHAFKKAQKRRLEFGGGDTDSLGSHGKRKMCYCCFAGNHYDDSFFHSPALRMASPQSPIVSPQSPCASEESYGQRQLSPVSSEDEYVSIVSRYDRSPSPCSSSGSDYAGLSWASPCSSPRSINNEVYSDSDDYSPVCSEADSTEFPLNTNETEGSVEGDGGSECTEAEENLPFEEALPESSTNTLKISLIFEITRLIRTYIKIHPPILQLGSEKLLIALLNCTKFFNSKHSTYLAAVNVVCDILHTQKYLLPLMKSSFIEKIYDLTEFVHSTHCVICVDQSCTGKMVLKKLTNLAGCGIGAGIIAHALVKGTSEVKKQIILVIPYIVEDKKIIANLMLHVRGLDILMQLLKEDSEQKRRTIKSLCVLASKKLKIANPKKVAMDVDVAVRAFNVQQTDVPSKLVIFKLDDGKFVKADRDLLTENSDYFSALLSGYFKESQEYEVCLRDVKFKTLHCLLSMFGCVNALEKVDIDTLLDLIVLSDRYLMSDICCFVTNYVEKYKMTSKTVPVIYRWSLESRLNLLRVESIAYALVADVVDSMRFSMFNDLFNLGYSEELVDDIDELLDRYLTSLLYT